MLSRVTHQFMELVLLFCIANLCIVHSSNKTWTEMRNTSAPVTHFPSVKQTVTPTGVTGALTFADTQQGSTLELNSNKTWKNNSAMTSVANFSGLSSSSVSPFTITNLRKPGNTSYGSTDFSSGKSASTLSPTAWTTHQPTVDKNASYVTVPPATKEYSTKPMNNTDGTLPNISNTNGMYTTVIYAGQVNLKHPEVILTIAFSIMLVIVVLAILAYSLNKCKTRRRQYSHRPLDDTSYDSVDPYSNPEDTLVISGGLYDQQRVYNPTTVLEDEECQNDYLSFASRPGQFRLEFLPGEKEAKAAVNSAGFNSFH